MASIAIQRGHCFRTRGATGTAGHRGTEQQFTNQLGQAMTRKMRASGHTVHLLTADESVPAADVFVALHQDGSVSSSARGASVGYQTSTSASYATIWKRLYEAAGWPGGFRSDNYTAALRNYYGFRMASSPVEVIFEHGFATNRADEDWMWDNIERIANVHTQTLNAQAGTPADPGDDDLTPEQDQMLREIHQREVDGFPQYGMHPTIEAANLTLREVRGVGSDNTLRHFIQDQDRAHTADIKRHVTAEHKITRDLTREELDELWSNIEQLAEGGDGGNSGPINVSDADAVKIARAVWNLVCQATTP